MPSKQRAISKQLYLFIFDPEDGTDTFLRNDDKLLPEYTMYFQTLELCR
jgi:hypothetical protein